LKTTKQSIPKFLCQHHLLFSILRNENDPTTKLLNKLKIDYDVAKEQYINMTPNEEEFLENLPKRRTLQ
jgi:ATP-dependent Clp protease ATP-binding subunit ClpC